MCSGSVLVPPFELNETEYEYEYEYEYEGGDDKEGGGLGEYKLILVERNLQSLSYP